MSDEAIVKQRIENDTRDWKRLFDDYEQLVHQAGKKKEEADLYAENIVKNMRSLDVKSYKTYYGKLQIKDDCLKIIGNSAHYQVHPVKKKPEPMQEAPVL